jgi:hypothetical protein
MIIPTYVIGAYGKSITCLDCGNASWNAFDVIRRYCGVCREFHDDKEMKARTHERSAESLAQDPFSDWS